MSDHKIVLVRLDPDTSAHLIDSSRKYPNADAVAHRLNTHPFLGLCIWSQTLDPKITKHRHIIYPISTTPFKGPGPAHLRCFSLLPPAEDTNSNSSDVPSLSVVPPFPDVFCRQLRAKGKNLYLNLTPELNVRHIMEDEPVMAKESTEEPPMAGETQYRLSKDSFERFRTALREAAPKWARAACEDREAAATPRWLVRGNHVFRRSWFVFDSPLDDGSPSIDPLALALNESVETDIGLFQQYVHAQCHTTYPMAY